MVVHTFLCCDKHVNNYMWNVLTTSLLSCELCSYKRKNIRILDNSHYLKEDCPSDCTFDNVTFFLAGPWEPERIKYNAILFIHIEYCQIYAIPTAHIPIHILVKPWQRISLLRRRRDKASSNELQWQGSNSTALRLQGEKGLPSLSGLTVHCMLSELSPRVTRPQIAPTASILICL